MRNFHSAGIKERLKRRLGIAKINSIAVTTDNLDTHYPPGYQTYDYSLRTISTYTKISEGFKPKTSSTITKINLWLKKTGIPAGTDTITLEIMTDSSGIPSGTVVANGTSNAVTISSTLTTSYAWVQFTFAVNPTLVAGTQYHLVLGGAYTISSSNYVSWGADNYDVIFVDGSMSKNDSSIWTEDVNYNACFEVFITSGILGNDGLAIYDFASKNMLLGIFGSSLYKMDKNSAGTPDGTWDGIITGTTAGGTLDYMEYNSTANARTAYVTNASVYGNTGGTITTDGLYTVHKFTAGGTFTPLVTGVVEYLVIGGGGAGGGDGYDGGGGAGGFRTASGFAVTAGQAYSITIGAGGVDTGAQSTPGGNSVFSTITSIGGGYGGRGGGEVGGNGGSGGGGGGSSATGYAGGTGTSGQGSDGGAGFASTDPSSGGGGGASAVGATATSTAAGNGGAGTASSISGSSVTYAGGGGGGTYINTKTAGTASGGGGAGSNSGSGTAGTANTGGGGGGSGGGSGTVAGGAGGSGIVVIRCLTADYLDLQSYSEATIKTQGSYALKGVATTGALNKTLTRTIGSPIDLTGKTTIYFDIYAGRTGANIKIGIHDSGGTTTEKTYTVLAANTWETVTWDISAVSNANKDAIDSIIITIVNADAANTFYIDNMYAVLTASDYFLTSSRYLTFADWQSGRALINTDVGLYSYTGSGNALSVSAAPIGKFVVIFRNYVFMAGIRGLPNTIRYSDLSEYTTWTATNTLSANTNDGDIITGMRILKGKLYIFKRYSIHRISFLGSNPTFQVDQILGIGCPAHYTIKEVELGGDAGMVLIFLSTDKKLVIFDGYNSQVINDNLTEETNDLFGASDDQPLSFADMNLVYADLFHAVVKTDTSEYILYCVLGTDTAINYAFVFDYKTGGVYPYDNQIFASSCYVTSTNKVKILYCAGYSGYMWEQEKGNTDDGTTINAYWVSGKIRPTLVSLLMKALNLGINFKQVYSVSTLNASFQFRIDWNVSWTTEENFAYNRADVLTFGATTLFDIGTIENMLQIKINDDSIGEGITLHGMDLYGTPVLGHSVSERATA